MHNSTVPTKQSPAQNQPLTQSTVPKYYQPQQQNPQNVAQVPVAQMNDQGSLQTSLGVNMMQGNHSIVNFPIQEISEEGGHSQQAIEQFNQMQKMFASNMAQTCTQGHPNLNESTKSDVNTMQALFTTQYAPKQVQQQAPIESQSAGNGDITQSTYGCMQNMFSSQKPAVLQSKAMNMNSSVNSPDMKMSKTYPMQESIVEAEENQN